MTIIALSCLHVTIKYSWVWYTLSYNARFQKPSHSNALKCRPCNYTTWQCNSTEHSLV